MFKYIKLDIVLNHLTNFVKEQTDTPHLLQMANQTYRLLNLPNLQNELKVVAIDVVNHKVKLPSDCKKIMGLWWTSVPMPPDTYNIVVDLNEEEKIVTLQQQLLLSSPWHSTFLPLYNLSQGKSALIDNGLYCKDCGYGFSVDANLSCLTVDVSDVTLLLEYYSTLKDEDCNILIPDDESLIQGIAAGVSAKVFADLKDRGVAGSNEKYMNYLQMSQNLLNKFRGRVHLMNIQPALYEQFRMQRFDVPGGQWKYKRNPSFRRTFKYN